MATALAWLKGVSGVLKALLPSLLGLLLGRKQVLAEQDRARLKAKEAENEVLQKQRDNDVHSVDDALRVHREKRSKR